MNILHTNQPRSEVPTKWYGGDRLLGQDLVLVPGQAFLQPGEHPCPVEAWSARIFAASYLNLAYISADQNSEMQECCSLVQFGGAKGTIASLK